MAIKDILEELDSEIARLEQVRKLLSDGRNVQFSNPVAKKTTGRKKRRLSAEARKKIGEAQRKRWAAQKAKK